MVGEKAVEILKYHKSEKCFKCDEIVEKSEDGVFRCKCGFSWANMFIKRMPIKTYLKFKKFAEDEFCADYGMAFKKLMDDFISDRTLELIEVMRDLDNRISKLENPEKKVAKEWKSVDGKIHRIKEEEKNG